MEKDLKPKFGKSYFKSLTGGCLYKPESVKDYEFSAFLSGKSQSEVDFPDAYYTLWTPEVKNQQVKETCVAHALASASEILERYYNGGKNQKYSTAFIYANRHEGQYDGEGMYISQALANLKEDGVPKEETGYTFNLDYPDAKAFLSQNGKALYDEAAKHKIAGYARVRSEYEIKDALCNQKTPVIVGMTIYESFYDVDATGIVSIPNNNEKSYGGHCMLITGYTKMDGVDYWIVLNSWGEYFGDRGFCYVPMSADNLFYEKWAIVPKKFAGREFSDVENIRWSKAYIDKAVKRGLIEGFPDGTFKPDGPLTREQLCVVLSKLLNKLEGEE
ncbi:MAG: S-layer homology domain-containing protein [Firmicutes bacterium]|nr:S-layer homology domain-containing protein [Bacillota bacterium]